MLLRFLWRFLEFFEFCFFSSRSYFQLKVKESHSQVLKEIFLVKISERSQRENPGQNLFFLNFGTTGFSKRFLRKQYIMTCVIVFSGNRRPSSVMMNTPPDSPWRERFYTLTKNIFHKSGGTKTLHHFIQITLFSKSGRSR